MPVTLSRGDGARGELELLTCAYQPSSMFLARTGFHIGVLSVCALGCGEALKDGGSGICRHADEVPCIFVSWLNVAFMVRIRLWRSCHLFKKGRSRRFLLRVKCGTLKCVTLEGFFQQHAVSLKPIGFASWAEKHSMPHVIEPKRPSNSDPKDAIRLSIWWLRCAELRSLNITSATPFKHEAAPKP